ncbi:hypothetical protein N476_21115 [Pseudoalteromonas luteoviolacea H33]|uniref:Uncharacterized protein n=1 Tax=Pseudoalteromonas luteoviolacea H33 TaxID=1365251 RepID=A0A167DDY7_9GAMM|nr:hypothetical protein N476_21115 [Pseudoalteromonas luteoviolacea H33]KZN75448.1 hypothetical protein N477_01670 [Pseudoalteromonas luteoviolacea H33-S]
MLRIQNADIKAFEYQLFENILYFNICQVGLWSNKLFIKGTVVFQWLGIEHA